MSCQWPGCEEDYSRSTKGLACRICRRILCDDHCDQCEREHCLNPEPGVDYRDEEDLNHILGFAQDALAKIERYADPHRMDAEGILWDITEETRDCRDRQIHLMSRFRRDFERVVDREMAARARKIQ